MKFLFSSPTRASMLLAALVLVGGTGCVTSMIIDRRPLSKHELRAQEQAYQERIAGLARAAETGEPAAETALADALTDRLPAQIDPERVLAMLSRAAGKGYVPAQAMLGSILAWERIGASYGKLPLPPGLRDRERGIQLLRQAASRACLITPAGMRIWIQPAASLSAIFKQMGLRDEERLWEARSVLHCDEPDGVMLSAWTRLPLPEDRTKALALLLLRRDSERIAKAEASMPPGEVAAARRDAEQLRREVAQSEQQYPAPARKEMQ